MRFKSKFLLAGIVLLLVSGYFIGVWWHEHNQPSPTPPASLPPNACVLPAQLPVVEAILRENDLKNLVTRIDSAGSLNYGGVGIAGIYTWENACFERLRQIAADEQLEELLNHQNPLVRAYAYRALATNNKELAHKWRNKLSRDTATFYEFRGCLRMSTTIAAFVAEE